MKILNHLTATGILAIIMMTGCTFTTTFTNRDQDKKDAEKVTKKFFEIRKSKNYDAMYNLFSSKFWEVTSVKKMNEIYDATQNKLGDLKNIKLDDWTTKVVTGTNPSAEYQLEYHDHYQNYDAKETFELMRDTDGEIRIIGYDINSEGFLK